MVYCGLWPPFCLAMGTFNYYSQKRLRPIPSARGFPNLWKNKNLSPFSWGKGAFWPFRQDST